MLMKINNELLQKASTVKLLIFSKKKCTALLIKMLSLIIMHNNLEFIKVAEMNYTLQFMILIINC